MAYEGLDGIEKIVDDVSDSLEFLKKEIQEYREGIGKVQEPIKTEKVQWKRSRYYADRVKIYTEHCGDYHCICFVGSWEVAGDIIDTHNATLGRDAAEEAPRPCPAILDEQWTARFTHIGGGGRKRYTVTNSRGGVVVAESVYGEQIAALPDMLRVLMVVANRSSLSRIQRGTQNADTITVKLNVDDWRVITDALERAGVIR